MEAWRPVRDAILARSIGPTTPTGSRRQIANGQARTAGASTRTLARLFPRETGLGFAHWRQQARLLRALERLAAGEPVTTVALDLGYDGPSAFIAMFRSRLGTTPGRYFADPPTPAAGGGPPAGRPRGPARSRTVRNSRRRAPARS